MSKRSMLIFHANCPDGHGAKYAFWKKYGDLIDYRAVKHGDPIPEDIDGRNIWMVDFCFKFPEMEEVLERATYVIVIDHHITAMESMEGFTHPKLETTFDMKSSGAVMAWRYLFPDEEVPLILQYVEDRDIHKWELEGAEALLANLDSHEMSLAAWDDFAQDLTTPRGLKRAIRAGKILLNYKKEISDSIKENMYHTSIRGIEFPIINTAVIFRGDILSEIAYSTELGVAAGYHFDGKQYTFSLRSRGEINVAKIAESFPGGGGHKEAAGFSVLSLENL